MSQASLTVHIAGHKGVGALDLPESIAARQEYLSAFGRTENEGGTAEQVVAEMLTVHGDRDNPGFLWHSARTTVAKRSR